MMGRNEAAKVRNDRDDILQARDTEYNLRAILAHVQSLT